MQLAFVILCVILNYSEGHIPDYQSTPSDKFIQHCILAETCVHDTIPICGKSGEDMRTFLDTCDLLEYVCDVNEMYIHVEDMAGCPVPRVKQP